MLITYSVLLMLSLGLEESVRPSTRLNCTLGTLFGLGGGFGSVKFPLQNASSTSCADDDAELSVVDADIGVGQLKGSPCNL